MGYSGLIFWGYIEKFSRINRVINDADTFFIASAAHRTNSDGEVQPPHGVDVSHRGGPEGFVKVSSDGKQLKWADYKGNNFFMTLGNISATGLVSLLFCDYISGSASVVAGHARCAKKFCVCFFRYS